VISPIPRPLTVRNAGFLVDTSLWFFLSSSKMEFEVNESNPLFRNRNLDCVDAASTANTLVGVLVPSHAK
jgi:hypothetical protein